MKKEGGAAVRQKDGQTKKTMRVYAVDASCREVSNENQLKDKLCRKKTGQGTTPRKDDNDNDNANNTERSRKE